MWYKHIQYGSEKILDLPMVMARNPDDFTPAQPPNNILLNTIKVPKNLHYLTDRLPKPTYLKKKDIRLDNSEERDETIS